jgi:hypothetical protein
MTILTVDTTHSSSIRTASTAAYADALLARGRANMQLKQHTVEASAAATLLLTAPQKPTALM